MIKLIKTIPQNAPLDFILLAQNMITYEVIGETQESGFEEIIEIPLEFIQRCKPSELGTYMDYAQIKAFKSRDELQTEIDDLTVEVLEKEYQLVTGEVL